MLSSGGEVRVTSLDRSPQVLTLFAAAVAEADDDDPERQLIVEVLERKAVDARRQVLP